VVNVRWLVISIEELFVTDRPKYHLDAIFDPARAHPDDAHSVLMRLVPPRTRVLELGCASGYLSGYLEKVKNCRVTGLEADPNAARIAATRCSEVYTVDLDTPDSLSMLTGPYDVLLTAAVLEHLKDAERLLNAVRSKKILAPNAVVIVSLPNVAHWSIRLSVLRGRFDYTDYGIMDRTHLHFYTVRTGRALLENCGYRVQALAIAGSALQNVMNSIARKAGRPYPKPILPGLLGYELIYQAVLTPQ
jgi:methionine biosynthesis protein MetW